MCRLIHDGLAKYDEDIGNSFCGQQQEQFAKAFEKLMLEGQKYQIQHSITGQMNYWLGRYREEGPAFYKQQKAEVTRMLTHEKAETKATSIDDPAADDLNEFTPLHRGGVALARQAN